MHALEFGHNHNRFPTPPTLSTSDIEAAIARSQSKASFEVERLLGEYEQRLVTKMDVQNQEKGEQKKSLEQVGAPSFFDLHTRTHIHMLRNACMRCVYMFDYRYLHSFSKHSEFHPSALMPIPESQHGQKWCCQVLLEIRKVPEIRADRWRPPHPLPLVNTTAATCGRQVDSWRLGVIEWVPRKGKYLVALCTGGQVKATEGG